MATGTIEPYEYPKGLNGPAGYWAVSGNIPPVPTGPLVRQITILTDIGGNVVLNDKNTSSNEEYAYALMDGVGFAHRHTDQGVGNVRHSIPVSIGNAEFVCPQCLSKYTCLNIVGTKTSQ